MLLLVGFVFFFKQKTAYEMRISDWSSDVCSSDLLAFALLLSVPLGVFAALRPNTLIDRFALGIAVAGQAMPSFLFGLGLIYIFGVKLGWLPFSGSSSWRHFILRSEEHTSELQSLMRISYAVFCLKKKKIIIA